mgnify:CR=1 FL=1|jgi:hypothetical protein
MRYPCLVQKRFCKTKIRVELDQEGTGNYGAPLEPVIFEGKCNYQDCSKTILTDEKKVIQLTGVALFPGDIAPELPTLSGGFAIVNGVRRRIQQGMKAKNPDGTVNYCKLELI